MGYLIRRLGKLRIARDPSGVKGDDQKAQVDITSRTLMTVLRPAHWPRKKGVLGSKLMAKRLMDDGDGIVDCFG